MRDAPGVADESALEGHIFVDLTLRGKKYEDEGTQEGHINGPGKFKTKLHVGTDSDFNRTGSSK